MHVHKGFLPEQPDGKGKIHHNPDFNDTTRICRKYNLAEKAHNGYIYARVKNGMKGLPQAVQIAHEALLKHFDMYGYHPSIKPPELWKQNSQPINFTLVVDDFGVKY